MKIKIFINSLIKPKSSHEDLKRREYILNVILFSSILLLIVAVIIKMIDILTLTTGGLSLVVIISILLIFLFLYFLSRTGLFITSAYILVGVYFTLATYMTFLWGVELPVALLFYIMIIIVSGILISTRFAFIITISISLTIALVNYLHVNGVMAPDLYWKKEVWEIEDIIVLSIILLIIATVSWLSNREIEKSLKRARKSEAELKEERDMLEIRVENRTQELQKTQMEKMAQIYKFAEFGRLSGGLFHDLINPLNAVSLNIEKIKETGRLGGEFQEVESDLERTIKATNRMRDFINSVKRQIAHEDSPELFSINQEINEAIEVLKYRARKNNVEIIFKSKKEVQTLGSPIKFNQVMINLINNAIDAYLDTNKDIIREIKIDLAEENNTITISVRDYGRGVPKDILDKIFEPFFTTKNFKQNKSSGTGIGLSLTKRIIEKDFDGSIKIESEENKGAKFTIKFPLIT